MSRAWMQLRSAHAMPRFIEWASQIDKDDPTKAVCSRNVVKDEGRT
jgi:hypothetical protein